MQHAPGPSVGAGGRRNTFRGRCNLCVRSRRKSPLARRRASLPNIAAVGGAAAHPCNRSRMPPQPRRVGWRL
eukprot:6383191-Pyramimonas_sp.AAC.1